MTTFRLIRCKQIWGRECKWETSRKRFKRLKELTTPEQALFRYIHPLPFLLCVLKTRSRRRGGQTASERQIMKDFETGSQRVCHLFFAGFLY